MSIATKAYRNQAGASLTEYGLILALVVVGLVGAAIALSDSAQTRSKQSSDSVRETTPCVGALAGTADCQSQ